MYGDMLLGAGVLKRHFLAWDTLPCAGTPESGPAQVLRLPKDGAGPHGRASNTAIYLTTRVKK